MPEPTPGQLALLFLAIACYVIGGVFSLARLRFQRAWMPIFSRQALYLGLALSLSTLIWHSISRGSWWPVEDNFDSFIWLATLLAGIVLYVQRVKPLPGLDWFVMPAVVILLILAGIFGRTRPHEYVESAWHWSHRVTAYGGAVAFAVAAAVGAMYLIVNGRLRSKRIASGPELGSLERLENLTRLSVTLGFALLTVGLVTGLVRALDSSTTMGRHWFASPKVLLACSVWVVYALVLHAPINPSFRGRRAALLSVIGFVLMIGTMIAVQFMPEATR